MELKERIEQAFIQIFASEGDTGFRYMFTESELKELLREGMEDAHNKGWEDNFHEQNEQDKANLVFVDREIRKPESYFKKWFNSLNLFNEIPLGE